MQLLLIDLDLASIYGSLANVLVLEKRYDVGEIDVREIILKIPNKSSDTSNLLYGTRIHLLPDRHIS